MAFDFVSVTGSQALSCALEPVTLAVEVWLYSGVLIYQASTAPVGGPGFRVLSDTNLVLGVD